MYYFASDMHLGFGDYPVARQREDMLVGWLEKVSADAKAIFLLGDVFDFWFEYNAVVPKGFVRVLGKIAQLTDRGIEVHLFVGNHDMWSDGYFARECGMTLHFAHEIVELYGKRLFLAHGDNIGRRTRRERFLNSFFRNKTAKWIFQRVIHPDLAMRFGRWWSHKSRKTNDNAAYKFWGDDEPLVKYAREVAAQQDVDYFIFGHIHHCVDFPLDASRRAIFLGDWINNPSYAALAPDGTLTLNKVDKA